jgi:hypothetical protein
LTCTYLAKRLRELSSTKTGSYPHEFLCRTNCSACADYQPCILSSVLWYPLRFPHNGDIRFVFAFFTDTDIQHNSHKRWCSCCLAVTRRVPLVEQELLMFPDHLSSPILASCCEVCCRSLLVFISFLFWPFWCLYFFNLRLLIITLVSSRFSYFLRF